MDTILYWLGRASWQASLLAIIVLVAQRIFRRQLTAQWRYNLWLLVMLRFLLPFSLESSVSVFNFMTPGHPAGQPVVPMAETIASVPASAKVSFIKPALQPNAGQPESATTLGVMGEATQSIATNSSAPQWQWSWPYALAIVWFSGVLFCSAFVLNSTLRFARRLRSSKIIRDVAVLAVLDECKVEIGTNRAVTLLATEAVSTPALYGFWHPRLLLPTGMTESFDCKQLRFVFLHEMAHVKRWDIAVNWLMTVLQIVYWYNPLAWLAFNRMRMDRELACDALVLNRTGAHHRKTYGETILSLLEGMTGRVTAPGLVGIVPNKRELQERMQMIARFRPASRGSAWAGLLILIIGMSGLTDALTKEAIQLEDNGLQSPKAAAQQEHGRKKQTAGTWEERAPADLKGRGGSSVIWSGDEMIVFGGEGMGESFDDGARYNLAENTWAALPEEGAPSSRTSHSAVWTGREMIIWGGFGGKFGNDTNRNDGALFDPRSNSWKPVSTENAPQARFNHTAVWTGKEMLIWGGYTDSHSWYHGGYNDAHLNTGGRYDPATDSWQEISTKGAPSKRFNHVAVWTGKAMIVWGGGNAKKSLNDGAIYDPVNDEWRPISKKGAPSPRGIPVAVWTGKEMIIWGGASRDGKYFQDGARYNPETDTWAPISKDGAPNGRIFANGVWTGTEMVFWGGVNDAQASGFNDPNRYVDDGARYNPSTDSWTEVKPSEVISGRLTGLVWTGKGLLAFGGYNGRHLNDVYYYSR
ncbi:MAG: hypothetical protein JWQ71_396 [Pedosphaera sp.]|nr:hypothetical protein [Pedosphaera sp.]